MEQVITVQYRDKIPKGYKIINCTTQSKDEYRRLSPFMTTNPYCYAGLSAKSVENAWQYSKIYPEYADENGDPTPEWFKWRDKGFSYYKAIRYPMGKGAIPLYSWWNGARYKYIEARKRIYVPLYELSIKNNPVFISLKREYEKGTLLAIRDFDVYRLDLEGLTVKDAINNPDKKFGHGFVLYKMLTQEDI